MSVSVSEIATIIRLVKEGVEWLQNQKKLGNITQEQFDEIFERIEDKKKAWDDLDPDNE